MIKRVSSVLACAFAFASLGSATVIAPGNTSVAPSVFSNAGWTLVASNTGQALTSGTFTGTASAWVYTDTNNSFCPGCLDFVYQVTRTAGSDPIEKVTAGSFTGFSTDVGYLGTSVGNTPTNVDRSSNGSVISFNFNSTDALTGTQGSRILIVQTNATTWSPGLMSAIDQQAANASGFQPAPEPATLSLIGLSLLGLGLVHRRKSKA